MKPNVKTESQWEILFAAAEWTKNKREVIRLSVTGRGGQLYISLRAFYREAASGNMLPGAAGITFPLDSADPFFRGVAKLRRRAVKKGWLAEAE